MTALSQYLSIIRENLRLDPASVREVLQELQTHIEDKLEEMRKAGLSEEEAVNTCLKLFGSAKLVARQIYEAHSQGTWKQALMAAMPHLLFALLFILKWWHAIGWLTITLGLVVITAIYGWRHGKPMWLFSWLGYSLLPVIAAGLLLLYLPRGWSWLVIAVYLPLALWLVGSVTIQTIRRDWLLTALMIMPLPILVGWFLAAGHETKLGVSLENIRHFDFWIGLSFLALAITAAAFIRLRQRWLRLALLVASGLLSLSLVALYPEARLGLSTFLVLALLMLVAYLSPAFLERWIRFGKQESLA